MKQGRNQHRASESEERPSRHGARGSPPSREDRVAHKSEISTLHGRSPDSELTQEEQEKPTEPDLGDGLEDSSSQEGRDNDQGRQSKGDLGERAGA